CGAASSSGAWRQRRLFAALHISRIFENLYIFLSMLAMVFVSVLSHSPVQTHFGIRKIKEDHHPQEVQAALLHQVREVQEVLRHQVTEAREVLPNLVQEVVEVQEVLVEDQAVVDLDHEVVADQAAV
ncbi:hypothetical protein KI387_022489, partial [Taxus chinensis]